MGSPPWLSRHKRDVEAFLRSTVERPGAPLLYRMARYHMGWEDEQGNPTESGGKRLRPALCLMVCEGAGGGWRDALPAAAAVELVHSFSLVHDDIQDRDAQRHHRPSVWAVWGEAQAINVGDALLTLAQMAIAGLAERGLPAERIMKARRLLDEATLEMVEGQTLDMAYEGQTEVGLEAYMEMIEKKSGALFGCAMGLGALTAGADDSLVKSMDLAGRGLGTAFQARDDILGAWGDEAKTGKPAASDISRRKKALPFVVALARGDPATGSRLKDAYARGDVSCVLDIFESLQVGEACEAEAQRLGQEAIARLRAPGLDERGVEELMSAADYLLRREF